MINFDIPQIQDYMAKDTNSCSTALSYAGYYIISEQSLPSTAILMGASFLDPPVNLNEAMSDPFFTQLVEFFADAYHGTQNYGYGKYYWRTLDNNLMYKHPEEVADIFFTAAYNAKVWFSDD